MSNHKDDDDAEVAWNHRSTSEMAVWLPQEILSQIFSEVHWSEYNITPETRYEATFLSISSRDEKRHPESYIGIGGTEHVPWFEYVRNLKPFSSVCSSWRAAVMPMLYECVYLFQIGQLPALIRTLEDSSENHEEGHKNASSELDHTSEQFTGHGVWIKHIQIAFFVPRVWINLFRMEVLRLLSLCPSLQSMIYRPEWDSEIGAENMPMLLNILRYSMPSRFEQLQELSISNVVLSKEIFDSLQALSNLPKLMKLELELPNLAGYQEFRSARLEGLPSIKVVLPVLETLVLKIVQYNDYLRLEAFGSLFDLPALSRLTIDMFYSDRNGNSTLSPLEEFCAHTLRWFCPSFSAARNACHATPSNNRAAGAGRPGGTPDSVFEGKFLPFIRLYQVTRPSSGWYGPVHNRRTNSAFRTLPAGMEGTGDQSRGYNNQPLDTWIENREYENYIAEVEDNGSDDFTYMRNSKSWRLLLERERWRQGHLDDDEGWSVEDPDPETIEQDLVDEREIDLSHPINIFPLSPEKAACQSVELLDIHRRVLSEDEEMLEEYERMPEEDANDKGDYKVDKDEDEDGDYEGDYEEDTELMSGIDEDEGEVLYYDDEQAIF
ncbi:hypothetical protein PNOK_0690300 [Pyrrhoderma noxium]|uniref:F-box domain-containing protein n=1 Tax=Pyrrhoderma noxium TaxID=2282107 RepID=A0A286UBA8_9AGAM|nr:hypothetical protein PNOK_0690300 [Pyrrhoderma noxium]